MTTNCTIVMLVLFVSGFILEILKDISKKSEYLFNEIEVDYSGKNKFICWCKKALYAVCKWTEIISLWFFRTFIPAACIYLIACLIFVIISKRDCITGEVNNQEIMYIISAFGAWIVYMYYNLIFCFKSLNRTKVGFMLIYSLITFLVAGLLVA